MGVKKGSITIMASILFLVFVILVGTLSDLARISYSYSKAVQSANLNAQSVMANYDSDLQARYGLFAMSNNTNYSDNFTDMMNYALNPTSFQALRKTGSVEGLVKDAFFSDKKVPTNFFNPYEFKVELVESKAHALSITATEQQILQFMKYRAPLQFVEPFLKKLEAVGKSSQTASSLQTKVELDKSLAGIEKVYNEILKHMDGWYYGKGNSGSAETFQVLQVSNDPGVRFFRGVDFENYQNQLTDKSKRVLYDDSEIVESVDGFFNSHRYRTDRRLEQTEVHIASIKTQVKKDTSVKNLLDMEKIFRDYAMHVIMEKYLDLEKVKTKDLFITQNMKDDFLQMLLNDFGDQTFVVNDKTIAATGTEVEETTHEVNFYGITTTAVQNEEFLKDLSNLPMWLLLLSSLKGSSNNSEGVKYVQLIELGDGPIISLTDEAINTLKSDYGRYLAYVVFENSPEINDKGYFLSQKEEAKDNFLKAKERINKVVNSQYHQEQSVRLLDSFNIKKADTLTQLDIHQKNMEKLLALFGELGIAREVVHKNIDTVKSEIDKNGNKILSEATESMQWSAEYAQSKVSTEYTSVTGDAENGYLASAESAIKERNERLNAFRYQLKLFDLSTYKLSIQTKVALAGDTDFINLYKNEYESIASSESPMWDLFINRLRQVSAKTKLNIEKLLIESVYNDFISSNQAFFKDYTIKIDLSEFHNDMKELKQDASQFSSDSPKKAAEQKDALNSEAKKKMDSVIPEQGTPPSTSGSAKKIAVTFEGTLPSKQLIMNAAAEEEAIKAYKRGGSEEDTVKTGLSIIAGIGKFLADAALNLRDNIYVNEYIMGTFKNHLSQKDNWDDSIYVEAQNLRGQSMETPSTVLNYEVEYIINGNVSGQTIKDDDNYFVTTAKIFGIRLAMNVIHIYATPTKRSTTIALATAMAGWWTAGLGIPLFQVIVTGIWAALESSLDVMLITKGHEIAFYKFSGDWLTDITGAHKAIEHIESAFGSTVKHVSNQITDQSDQIIERGANILIDKTAKITEEYKSNLTNYLQATGITDPKLINAIENQYKSYADEISNQYQSQVDASSDLMMDYLARYMTLKYESKEDKHDSDVQLLAIKEELYLIANNLGDAKAKVQIEYMLERIRSVVKANPPVVGSTTETATKVEVAREVIEKRTAQITDQLKANLALLSDDFSKYYTEQALLIQKQMAEKLTEFLEGSADKVTEGFKSKISGYSEELKAKVSGVVEERIGAASDAAMKYIKNDMLDFTQKETVKNSLGKLGTSVKTSANLKSMPIRMGYTDYLRLFLLIGNKEKKIARAMDLIQLNMKVADNSFDITKAYYAHTTDLKVEVGTLFRTVFLIPGIDSEVFKNMNIGFKIKVQGAY